MQTNFEEWYAGEMEKIIGRKLTSGDGFPASEIAECERRLGVPLPLSVRDYYALAGKHELNTVHNRLYPPNALELVGEKLRFMEENQCVVFQYVELDGSPDPEVFQAQRERPTEFYSEECTFSEFIIKLLRWTVGADGAESPDVIQSE